MLLWQQHTPDFSHPFAKCCALLLKTHADSLANCWMTYTASERAIDYMVLLTDGYSKIDSVVIVLKDEYAILYGYNIQSCGKTNCCWADSPATTINLNNVFDIFRNSQCSLTKGPVSLEVLARQIYLTFTFYYGMILYCMLCLCWYSQVELGCWGSYLFSCDRSLSHTEALQRLFVVWCQCPDAQQRQMGAREKMGEFKEWFCIVLFAGLFCTWMVTVSWIRVP